MLEQHPGDLRQIAKKLSPELETKLLHVVNSLGPKLADVPRLTLWKFALKDMIITQGINSSSIVEMIFYTCWVQADNTLNQEINTHLEDNNVNFSPLSRAYWGACSVENGQVIAGLSAIESSLDEVEANENWEDFIVISSAYLRITGNLGAKKKRSKLADRVVEIFKSKFSNDEILKPYVIPAHNACCEHDKKLSENFQDLYENAVKHDNQIYAGLLKIAIAINKKDLNYYNEGIQHYQSIDAKIRLGFAYNNLRGLFWKQKNLDKVSFYSNKLKELGKSVKTVKLIYLLEKAKDEYTRGDLYNSEQTYRQIQKEFKNFEYFFPEIDSNLGLAHIYTVLSQSEEAKCCLENALNAISTMSKTLDSLKYKDWGKLEAAQLFTDNGDLTSAERVLSEIEVSKEDNHIKAFFNLVKAKLELQKLNIGHTKSLLTEILEHPKFEKIHFKGMIKVALGEAYLSEYRITENKYCLEEAEKLFAEASENIDTEPERIRLEGLKAFLLVALEKYTEAKTLINIEIKNAYKNPRVKSIFKKLLMNIDHIESGGKKSDLIEVLNYLQYAKSVVDLETR